MRNDVTANQLKEDLTIMPREKLLEQGAETLTDAELLAIFLRTGIKGMPVMELAKAVLGKFGSLRGLLTADLDQFCSVKGLGKTQYIQLQATKEINKRYLSQKMHSGIAIESPMLAVMFFQSSLEQDEREVFMVIFLDSKHRFLRSERLFYGTINQTAVHPREVIKACLKYNAAAIIIAHNHPSGDCKPSQADRDFTKRMKQACDLVNVRLVDHIIVGKGDYFSFEEESADIDHNTML